MPCRDTASILHSPPSHRRIEHPHSRYYRLPPPLPYQHLPFTLHLPQHIPDPSTHHIVFLVRGTRQLVVDPYGRRWCRRRIQGVGEAWEERGGGRAHFGGELFHLQRHATSVDRSVRGEKERNVRCAHPTPWRSPTPRVPRLSAPSPSRSRTRPTRIGARSGPRPGQCRVLRGWPGGGKGAGRRGFRERGGEMMRWARVLALSRPSRLMMLLGIRTLCFLSASSSVPLSPHPSSATHYSRTED